MNEREKLKQEFLDRWTLENVKKMNIDDYTNLDRDDSFTYWLERKTSKVLGIGGGSSYKFGIFKRNPNSPEKGLKSGQVSDGEYGWYSKYGNNKDEAFQKILNLLVNVIESAKTEKFSDIDGIDLGNSFKWKLAYMYAPKDSLIRIAQDKAFYYLEKKYLKSNTKVISYIQDELKKKKKEISLSEDFDLFSDELWKDYHQNNITEKEFRNWLKNIKQLTDSTIDKYIKRLKSSIPKELVRIGIFEYDLSLFDADIEELENIFEELKINGQLYQWNISSKVKNEASAALGNYLTFLDKYDSLDLIKNNDIERENKMLNDVKPTQPLNQILYGSPGTGKTYNTINKALEIIFQEKLGKEDYENGKVKEEKLIELSKNELTEDEKEETKNDSRKILKACFEKYKSAGQIEFVTFHQSYGYEEFVEGIKAETKGENINYEVKAGIFKSLVEKSLSKGELVSSNEKISEKNVIWKMSLGDSQTGEDKEYFDEAIKTNCLIMGYGDDIDFTSFSTKENIKDKNIDKTTIDMIDRFKNQMKKDDIVIISDGNRKFKAIAIVDGDYFYDSESIYKQKRKIKWLQRFTISRDVKEISEKFFTQATLNKPQWINLDKLNSLISNDKQADNTTKNYVLIIDEINRGNISKIFGELITLIEESKRLEKDEQIEITLPYSGEKFGVPQNLYIIGTMNTADRSIAPIDTALRRRFVFEEMAPDSSLLKNIKIKDGDNETDIKLDELLEAINTRIEHLYDRDHTIGHAYLIDVKNLDDLRFAFKNKIIPLLAEYFYEDWENIDLVLNKNGMIEEGDSNNNYLKNINKINGKKIYKVSNDKWEIENFINIYLKA